MKPPLKTLLLLLTVLCGLSYGVPTGGKFSGKLKPGPDLSNATVQMHHMTLADGGVVIIRATAAPSNIAFTIIIQVTQYHCANVNENELLSEHLGCSFNYERTLSMNNNAEIVWQNPNADITYCGKDGRDYLADEDDDFHFFYINTTSVYLVSISLYADHSQKEIKEFSLSYTLEMRNWYGYLNLVDYPSLIFYGVMVGVYTILGIVWIILLAISYKDLLRLQLWIALVIFLGMLEKAFFVAMYSTVNQTGVHVENRPLYIIAELISSGKKSLARMLLIIVSLGYGTVKPTLGGQMNKVIAVGAIYGVFSFLDGITRAYSLTDDTGDNAEYFTMIPIVIIDTIILYWTITAIKDTRHVLRLRRNAIKLSFYNHLIYAIAIAIVLGIIFMLWSIIYLKSSACLKNWKELWFDDAFWHILFTFLLVVIMILWRPSTNPERLFYSVMYEEDDFDEPEQGPNDNFGDIKLRKVDSEPKGMLATKVEDDLKWAEENLPTSAIDTLLPLIGDSDEEVMTTKFEQSKMN